MTSYKAPAYDLDTFISQVFQNSPSTSGGGDIQASSNNLFTGVNTFDDNIQVGTIESKSTSNDLVLTNTSSSTNATTHYISSPLNEIRTNQHISSPIKYNTSIRYAKGSSDHKIFMAGHTGTGNNDGKYTLGYKSSGSYTFHQFTASGTAGSPLSHAISHDGSTIGIVMDNISHRRIDIYNTSDILASTTPSPFYSSAVGFLASGSIELSYDGTYLFVMNKSSSTTPDLQIFKRSSNTYN
ncbi:MAG: hypothetical protein CMA64_08800, partial [Euryarchaeota archaeon]|nr:hypothetical protein [Euryarchaeota archaeon]